MAGANRDNKSVTDWLAGVRHPGMGVVSAEPPPEGSLAEHFGRYKTEGWAPKFYSTGIDKLDRATGGGFPAGYISTIGARTGRGKSIFINSCIAGTDAESILLVSLEDDIMSTCHRIGRSSFGTDYMRKVTVEDQEDDVNKLVKIVCNYELVAIDYLGLLMDGRRQADNKETIDRIIDILAKAIKKTQTSIVLVAQLNRQGATWGVKDGEMLEPKLTHLEGSGRIEQRSKMIALLHRPPGMDDKMKVIIEKAFDARDGVSPVLNFSGEKAMVW